MFQVRLVHFSIASVPAKLMFSAQTSLSHFVLTCEVLEEFDEAGESVAVEPLCHLLGCGIWIRTIKLEKAEGGGGSGSVQHTHTVAAATVTRYMYRTHGGGIKT